MKNELRIDWGSSFCMGECPLQPDDALMLKDDWEQEQKEAYPVIVRSWHAPESEWTKAILRPD